MGYSRLQQITNDRIKKIGALRDKGIDPYPQKFKKKNDCIKVKKRGKGLKDGENVEEMVTIAGRLMSQRNMGRIAFGNILDETGDIQIIIQEGRSPADQIPLFKKFVDVGDFLGIEGNIMKSKRGEVSVLVKSITILSKSILPLPEKWHGIQDKEERYRKRYLDLIMNSEVKEVFKVRAKIITILRAFLEHEGFMEVETPIIQPFYGGANAKPFITHINALGSNAYLSVAPELYLKRLIVGGYEKIFTICKNFRNEGIDFSHNPEFTMMEYYAAYKDYHYHIDFIQRFINKLKKGLKLKDEIQYRENTISLKTPFKQITFRDLLMQEIEIDINKANTFSKFKNEVKIKKLNVDISNCKHYGALLDEVYKRTIRPKIIQPLLLTHYPVEMIALAKRSKSEPAKINSVQLIIAGAEIIKAYDELNDPLEQEKRFSEQERLINIGDDEAMPTDSDFIEALKYGMPPTAGLGIGIDRLVMILTGKDSIRDVTFFPFMKQRNK